MDLTAWIRNVPDFPKKGIVFRDVTTLLLEPAAFREAVDSLERLVAGRAIDKVACVESRGFVFGAPLALRLGCGLVLLRKPGKLPAETIRESYALEYGTDSLEMHRDAIRPGDRVVLVDDLLATGGTAAASARLVEAAGGKVLCLLFLIELAFLRGRDALEGREVLAAVRYDSE
ncbi:MAG: adenine phosphoribosyltransferase [Candidatus Latescibacterota bacterium]|nr:MAG: adenine phosphoribosyltransferase [Candidatus Latescibacterota bacterium]